MKHLVALLFTAFPVFMSSSNAKPNGRKCNLVEHPPSKGALLNVTYLTQVNQEQQRNIGLEDFDPLVNVQCSNFTRLFICLVHLPLCMNHTHLPVLLPCLSVCKEVFHNCYRYYLMIQQSWPEH